MGTHLLVNLYSTPIEIVKRTAAIPDSAAFVMAYSTGCAAKFFVAPRMLDLRIWKLMTAMTPMTEPHRPSKKLERN